MASAPSFSPTLSAAYTERAGLEPPKHGSIVSLTGGGPDGGDAHFRVTNEPKVDDSGTFTLELERI